MIITIVEGLMNAMQAILMMMRQHEMEMRGGSMPDDTGAMRGKGDYNKTGVEFAPPKRTRSASPVTRSLYGGNTSTGGNQGQPEPYTWQDMDYYPNGGVH